MPPHDNIPEIEIDLDGSDLRVGIVMSRFNQDVCEGLLSACTAELLRLGVAPTNMRIATVPGALEIPLTLQAMARSGRFDALIALGAVIRGETYHFELVSNEMGSGINRVGLDTGLPIANGVLKERIHRERADGRTILLTGHVLSEVEQLADDIVFLLDEGVLFKGTLAELRTSTQEKSLERAVASLLLGRSVREVA